MELREAATDDAEAIAKVHVASWQAAYKGLMPEGFLSTLSVEKRAEAWRRALETGRPRVVLAYVSGILAGWAAFGPRRDTDKDGTWGEVEAIYLLPAFWNQGIGQRLMDYACDSLRKMGYHHTLLWVLLENQDAQTFYRRIGFACDGLVKTFELGGAVLKETRYCRDLVDKPMTTTEPLSWTIHSAQASDIGVLNRLTKHAIATSVPIGVKEMGEVMQNVDENAHWAIAHPTDSVYLKCMLGTRTAGYVLVKNFWNLCCLFVDPTLHGQGIGRALLLDAIRLSEGRTDRAHMLVNASPNAIGFYRNIGFVPDESRQAKGSAMPMKLSFEK